MFKRVFILGLCGISLQAFAQRDPLAHLTKGQPKDVVKMIDRYVGCNHWGGEEPYNEERRKEIDSAMSDLRCDTLTNDEKIILQRYSGNKRVLEALKSAKEMSF